MSEGRLLRIDGEAGSEAKGVDDSDTALLDSSLPDSRATAVDETEGEDSDGRRLVRWDEAVEEEVGVESAEDRSGRNTSECCTASEARACE